MLGSLGRPIPGFTGRPEMLGKPAAMETKVRENAAVVAVVVLTGSHKFSTAFLILTSEDLDVF